MSNENVDIILPQTKMVTYVETFEACGNSLNVWRFMPQKIIFRSIESSLEYYNRLQKSKLTIFLISVRRYAIHYLYQKLFYWLFHRIGCRRLYCVELNLIVQHLGLDYMYVFNHIDGNTELRWNAASEEDNKRERKR